MKKSAVLLIGLSLWVTLPLLPVKKETKTVLEAIQRVEDRLEAFANDLTALKKKLEVVEEKVSAVTKNLADENQNKENLLLSLQFIKEEINDLKNNLAKINDRLTEMPVAGPPGISGGTEGADSENAAIQSPENLYYTAYSDYIKKNYALAIEGFKQFLKYYPNNALADNSLYWVGECYYAQRQYQEAVNTFTQLANSYGDGDKIPDATLKKGFALIEMGKQAEGIEVLKELTSKFPLSEEASLAQQKIKELME